jgi:hypothetical protein
MDSSPVRRVPLIAFITLVFVATLAVASREPQAAGQEVVRLAANEVALETPPFLEKGKRYSFTWPGGGPPQTYTIKVIRPDGWVQVDVAEDNTDPAFYVAGQVPTMWLHVGMAISIQEMRPLPGYGN